jgi:anaerobic magnesium-protoporphyrin IX monomethyl ester cyclase
VSQLRSRSVSCDRSGARRERACCDHGHPLDVRAVRVALVSVYSHAGCTLKDVAGGYGTVFEVGRSLPARLLSAAKARVADLPPLVLGYLAAQLRAHDVSVHDLRPGDPLPACDVAIVLSSIVDRTAERSMCARFRSRGVRTIAIGAYASARPDEYADVADAVITGEPEKLGAAILDADGIVRAGDVEDLDSLPFPAWERFPVARYRYAFLPRRLLPVGSARGCTYGCGYCPWRVTASFRERDPSRVAAEIAALKDKHGVRGIAFRDPLFNLDRDRVRELARRIAPLGVRFSAEMRADRLDDEMLETLARAGLSSLEIGVETKDRALLGREKRKPPQHEEIERVVRTAQALGVRVICNYMLGLPGDDEDKVRATVEWAKQIDSFAVQFTIATPYPGTTLGPRVTRLPLAPDAHTGFRPTFEHEAFGPERLEALREWAYVSYYFGPRYAWRFARSFPWPRVARRARRENTRHAAPPLAD